MKLSRVKHVHEPFWHLALTAQLRPPCACLCPGPNHRRSAGDSLCRCWCHALGMRWTWALCEREHNPERVSAYAPLAQRKLWKIVQGRGRGCQACARIGVELTKKDVTEARRRILADGLKP